VQAELLELITTPAGFFLDAGKRVYWLYLLSALVIASIVVTVQSGKFDLKNQLSSFFNPKYWFAKSSLYDVYLMLFNNALRILLLIPLFGSHLALTIYIGSFLQDTVGDAPVIQLNWFVIALIFTITFFLVEDLSRFCLHYCMHKYKFLWRFHKTHHSATILTPITLFRVHPVEHILYFVRGMLVFGVISGVFIWLFSGKLTALQVLGVDMFGFLFNFFAANLRHSHIWLSFGKLERFLVSPAQHQLHHSSQHNFANLGSTLSIWDGIMGTRLLAQKKQKLQFGLKVKSAS
jgi:sterol desaturase/sphingolipid hydroxylase (fatty acid hydroxylase superfamily)